MKTTRTTTTTTPRRRRTAGTTDILSYSCIPIEHDKEFNE
jgi:hypothetical protein